MIQLDCDKDVKGAEASLAKAMDLTNYKPERFLKIKEQIKRA